AVIMGLGIGLAAMSRAEAVTLFPLLVIPFAFLVTRRGDRKVNWKRGIRYALAACIAGGLLMAPWLLYNLTRFEHPVLVSNGVFEGRGKWQSRLATIEYYPLLASSLVGLMLLRRRRVPILPFVAIAATITITAATTFGITRYRAPVDAMLPVLAGGALVWMFEDARAKGFRPW